VEDVAVGSGKVNYGDISFPLLIVVIDALLSTEPAEDLGVALL